MSLMWCPKCKSEYRPGFTVCTDCGTPLVEKLSSRPALDPVFLEETVGDSAWELPELLHRMEIGCYTYAGNGIFVRVLPGHETPGKLYVDRSELERARQCRNLLSRPPQPVDEDELMEAYEDYMEDAPMEEASEEEEATGNAAWIVFVVLGAILIIGGLCAVFLR